MSPRYALFFLLTALAHSVSAATPDWREWPLGERLRFGGSAYFANLDTSIRLDGNGGLLGTTVSFERDLGLDDSKVRPLAQFRWRFAKRHQLGLSYFDLDRSAEKLNTVTIRFGDASFPVNDVPLQAFLDLAVLDFSYSYSLLFDERKELRLGLGVSLQDIAMGIQSLDVSAKEEVDGLAPLPTLNLGFAYAFTDKWILDLGLGWLDVNFDVGSDNYDGRIISLKSGIRYKAFDNVSFALGYELFDLDLEARFDEFNGTLNYEYSGPTLGVELFF